MLISADVWNAVFRWSKTWIGKLYSFPLWRQNMSAWSVRVPVKLDMWHVCSIQLKNMFSFYKWSGMELPHCIIIRQEHCWATSNMQSLKRLKEASPDPRRRKSTDEKLWHAWINPPLNRGFQGGNLLRIWNWIKNEEEYVMWPSVKPMGLSCFLHAYWYYSYYFFCI